MADVIIALVVVVLFTAFLTKLVALRHDRHNRVKQALCALVGLSGLAFLFGITNLPKYVTWIAGYPSLVKLLQHITLVLAGFVLQVLVLHVTRRTELARPIRRRAMVTALTIVTMSVLFFSAPLGSDTLYFVNQYADEPAVFAYLLVFLGFTLANVIDVGLISHGYAGKAPVWHIRAGLRAMVAAMVFGVAYVVHKAAYTTAEFFGVEPPWREGLLSTAFGGVAALLLIVTITTAQWGPATTRLHDWWRRRRDYRVVRPLWLAVCDAMPDLALLPPSASPAGLRRPDTELWVYRFVIEISDALLVLEPRFDSRTEALVREHPHARREPHLAATVTAACLAVALDAYRAAAEVEAGLTAPARFAGTSTDVPGELARLRQVARAYQKSPIVADIRAVHNRNGRAEARPFPPPVR